MALVHLPGAEHPIHVPNLALAKGEIESLLAPTAWVTLTPIAKLEAVHPLQYRKFPILNLVLLRGYLLVKTAETLAASESITTEPIPAAFRPATEEACGRAVFNGTSFIATFINAMTSGNFNCSTALPAGSQLTFGAGTILYSTT